MMPGERSVQIGRDAVGNVIITGDNATVTILQTTRILEPEVAAPSPIGPNPYKGLAAFQEEDAERFFGREEMVGELWKELRRLHEPDPSGAPSMRLFTVQGPSGSGKSSLVRAGLLPELARRPLHGLGKLRVAPVLPGAHPVDALALALARLITGDPTPAAKARELAEELRAQNDGLRRIAGDTPLLVFVDQFEEIYTLASPEERDIFVANLLDAAADRGRTVTVLLTLRNDFLPQTRHNERLHEIVARQNLFVRYLREDELRKAISEPARRAGHPLDEGTIELLVQETKGEEQALPALQFTLTQIWEGMANDTAPARTYQEIGGVAGSLAQEAQRLYDSLPEADQRIARRAFLRMVRIGYDIRDTARKVELDEVVAYEDDRDHVKAVLERFARPEARIITLAAEPDGMITARLTHEALLDRWTQFDEWLTPQTREDLLFHYGLEERARYWDRKGRADDLLWPRQDLERLRIYEQRSGTDMTEAQHDFFKASDRFYWRFVLPRWAIPTAAVLLTIYVWVDILRGPLSPLKIQEPGSESLTSEAVSTAASEPDDTAVEVKPEQGNQLITDSDVGRLEKILKVTGSSSLRMMGSPIVAIVGEPSIKALPGNPMTILDSPATPTDDAMANYVSSLAHSVRLIAPQTRLLFAPFSVDTGEALEQVLAYPQIPGVVLYAYSDSERHAEALERIASRGSTVILSAGKKLDQWAPSLRTAIGARMLLVASADLQGRRSEQSPSQSLAVFWAPGEQIPIPSELHEWAMGDVIQGPGPAAAVAAGIVARLLDRHPGLTPAQVIDVLRKTSRPVAPGGPPVLNLDAALAELTKNPPPLPTN